MPDARLPLVPEDRQQDPAAAVVRACWSHVMAAAGNRRAAETAAALYRNDPVTLGVVTRAAVESGSAQVPAWAGVLVSRSTASWLPSLAPASAAAALIAHPLALRVPLGDMPLNVPVLTALPTGPAWVAELGAIPVRAFPFSTLALDPRKLATIVSFSLELARVAGAAAIFEAILRQSASIGLDQAYFSTAAGSASAHQGLLYGLTPLAGTASMVDDLAALAAAVQTNGGSGTTVFVAHPSRAATAAIRSPELTAPILPSLALPVDRVVAVDPGGLVHGHSGIPEISFGENAVLHMDDNPTQIGTPGSPATVAAPTISAFQTATTALRMILSIAFGARPGAVAYADGCDWGPAP